MIRVRGKDRKAVRSHLLKTHNTASLFKNFTLSTAPLKVHTREIFPQEKPIVLSNSIDAGFIGLSRIARKNNSIATRPYALFYFFGTASHDKNFAMITPIII